MQLDDLLGLLFLFFFVILPAIQGFMRRGRQMPDDFEPDDIPLPGEGKAKPSTGPAPAPSPTQSSAPASSRPPASPPPRPTSPAPSRTPPQPPRPAPVSPQAKPSKTLEQIERERLTRADSSRTPPQPSRPAQPQPPRVPPPPSRSGEHWEFSSTPHDIVNGVVWHQILGEPRSQHWRRIRRPKR